jgi:hypothetical protein
MAQTTSANSKANFLLEVSVNGVDWHDISGEAATATPSGGDQLTGSQQTAEGIAAVVTKADKTEPVTIQCNIVYTEQSVEAFNIVWQQYDSEDKGIYLRYSPQGGHDGDERFYTADSQDELFYAPIVSCLPPEGDASSGDPLMTMFSVICPKLGRETIVA